MSDIWNADIYSQFLDLRTLPARDLLSAIPNTFQPKTVYDLGCGSGNSTVLLKHRWSDAQIIGFDASPAMLAEAESLYPSINFIEGNIEDFSPMEKVDCIFANASLQWLDEHQIIIPKLIACLRTKGILAIQMPNNFHAATHQVGIEILQNHEAWRPLIKKLRYRKLTQPLYHLPFYYDVFTKINATVLRLWETEYFQELNNYSEIYNWIKGTGLRPILSVMSEEDQILFENSYIKAIAKEYPLQANGKVLLPFRRVFMVGESRYPSSRSSEVF